MTFVRLGGDVPLAAPSGAGGTDFARLGGEPGVRAIIADFMREVFADAMIGFLFARAPQARIREMEYRYAAAHLGGPSAYDGRPLDEAHRASPISSGHFMRRRQILLETLRAHRAPEEVIGRWLAHVDAQRALVLGRAGARAEGAAGGHEGVDACGPAVRP